MATRYVTPLLDALLEEWDGSDAELEVDQPSCEVASRRTLCREVWEG